MNAYGRNNGRKPISYFAELLIIIIGIMVSFMLNEWREGNKMDKKKLSILKEIIIDLEKDSILIDHAIKNYTLLLRSHDSLLHKRNHQFEPDSLDYYLDHVISYSPFKESKTAYQKILTDPELIVEKHDTLIEKFLFIHQQYFPLIEEWSHIEKNFVLNQMIPFMDENAPFIYPVPVGKSFDGEVFYTLKKSDHFLNMLKSGQLYKDYLLKVYQFNLKAIISYSEELRLYLSQVEKAG